jgi:hypothetical protein
MQPQDAKSTLGSTRRRGRRGNRRAPAPIMTSIFAVRPDMSDTVACDYVPFSVVPQKIKAPVPSV